MRSILFFDTNTEVGGVVTVLTTMLRKLDRRLFRLAVAMMRSRSDQQVPRFVLRTKKKNLTLAFPQGWLDNHPLTRADLDIEAGYLDTLGYQLTMRESG